ncbi:uncharacterized protein EDB91DRAFT_306976 [Suillus paluster]|uniref:uncharacterized protein n=1 Tax=Suillus paluster TaxID=48578 RepID=UPI001B869B5A|nr:uncharacterized protein EDB91DRAFT_306976 [Suillus paluster]KAG1742316.1 hypothetical protein EDB91DRAFT_306976 [Suillus paluster]
MYKGRAGSIGGSYNRDFYEVFFKDFLSGPLASVLANRKEPYLLPLDHEQPIIDNVVGEDDRYSQCQSDSFKGPELWGPRDCLPCDQLIKRLFNCKTSAYDAWKKEDWLCDRCSEKSMRDNLHIWYLGEKVKRGRKIREDCWYGYNCRAKTHDKRHARRPNHWCEPIKGDVPST